MIRPLFLHVLLIVLTGTWALRAQDAPEPPPPLDTAALAQLAIQDHGRKKPFTTFAHEMVLILTGRSSVPVESNGQLVTLPAEEVILNLWLMPEGWDQKPLIFVTHLALKKQLGLPEDDEQKLFSFQTLAGNQALNELLDQTQKLRQAGKAEELTPVQKEAESLAERLQLFHDLVQGEAERIVPHPTDLLGTWFSPQEVFPQFQKMKAQALEGAPALSPSEKAQQDRAMAAGDVFQDWQEHFRTGNIAGFNELIPQLVAALRAYSPTVYPDAGTLAFEYQFMTLHPFQWAWIILLSTLAVGVLLSRWYSQLSYRIEWIGVIAGLGFESYGLFCRIVISGRPPVTDMYETVIWVAFAAMIFAVVLEAIYRRRYFFAAGVPASILALMIADTQPAILDASIHPLTAVLRNNMWLSIHVLTIVSSYAAFLLAAALGLVALILEMRRKISSRDLAEVHLYVYRAMQIGVLLLATGTILGAVWATYSWGRFWGWDPKETWALITLLCYLVLLHGRLVGYWKGFGLAFGSVLNFLSVMMSWYGVNYILGKGLHSYGFGTGGFTYVAIFVGTVVAFLAVAFWGIKLRPQPPEPETSGDWKE